MQIRYELSPDHLLAFSKEGAKGSASYNVQAAIFSVMGLVFVTSDMVLLVAAVFLNDGSVRVGDVGTSILIKIAIWVAVLALTGIVLTSYSRSAIKKEAEASLGINGVFCEHLIELGADGFTHTTHVNRSFQAWKGVLSIGETDSLVLITIRLGVVYIIPKSAFAIDAEMESFVSTVAKHLNLASVPPTPE